MRPTSTEAADETAGSAGAGPGAGPAPMAPGNRSVASTSRSVAGEAAELGGDAGAGSGESIGRPTAKHVAPTADTLRDRLGRRDRRVLPLGTETPASVLVALFVGPSGELRVWLLRKLDTLRRHAGQVALPGGKRDPEDRSALDTALREAEEEIGLPRTSPQVLGDFDDYFTTTGYVVWPHVAIVDACFEPVADPGEVARVFSSELAVFLETPTPQRISLFGSTREFPGYVIEGETVWGATSAILQDLARVLLA